jgi:hypothetical protein
MARLPASLNNEIRMVKKYFGDEELESQENIRHPIMCDGQQLEVNPNLYDALLELRRSRPGRYWIDAICINQQFHNERNAQVSMMGKIYNNAKTVLVWLGICPIPLRRATREWASDRVHLQDWIRKDAKPDDLHENAILFSASYIITRRWFRRLWTLQEALLSKDLLFLFGEHVFTPPLLLNILENVYAQSNSDEFRRFLDMSNKDPRRSVGYIGYVPVILNATVKFRAGGFWTLEQWLKACRGRKVTDIRDMIFAGLSVIDPRMLGIEPTLKLRGPEPRLEDLNFEHTDLLYNKPLWGKLRPDYEASAQEVLVNLAACLLTQSSSRPRSLLSLAGQKIDPLLDAYMETREYLKAFPLIDAEAEEVLPSWVPVPSNKAYLLSKQLGDERASPFDALTLLPNNPRISPDGKRLFLDASIIGRIILASNWTAIKPSERDERANWEAVRFLVFLNECATVYSATGEPIFEAIARASTADSWKSKSPAAPEITSACFRAVEEIFKSIVDAGEIKRPSHRYEEGAKDFLKGSKWSCEMRKICDGIATMPKKNNKEAIRKIISDIKTKYASVLTASNTAPKRAPKTASMIASERETAKQYELDTAHLWRTFYVTDTGYMGIAPNTAKEGDYIMLVPGGKTAYAFSKPQIMISRDIIYLKRQLLEKKEADKKAKLEAGIQKLETLQSKERREDFVFLGEAYCRGLMYGEGSGRSFEKISII